MRRQAFTIVELLVSFALIMFIMVILTEAFSAGMETFRELKAIGDLQERLRTASTILRRDLAADHFEGHTRLSDLTFWNKGYPGLGFFSISGFDTTKAIPGSTADGNDPSLNLAGYLVAPVRCPAPPPNNFVPPNNGVLQSHVLAFTVKLRGNQREQFFSAALPNGSTLPSFDTSFYGYSATPDAQFQDVSQTYNSQWAEVTYFLVRNLTSAGTGTPLYTLYRSQLVVVPNNLNVLPNPPTSGVQGQVVSDYQQMSCKPAGLGYVSFNTPGDLTNPANRLLRVRSPLLKGFPDPSLPNGTSTPDQWGATLLLSDVISFDVRALFYVTTGNGQGLRSYFEDVSTFAQAGFDTADPKVTQNNPYLVTNPPGYVIKALQISIRIWDLKTQQTRQVTIAQDL